jgi:hypothetical protein
MLPKTAIRAVRKEEVSVERSFILGICVVAASAAIASGQQKKPESRETKIARALSAAPPNIARAAKVVDRDDKGNEAVLREGTNGFTCFSGHPGVVGDPPFCANGPALQWEKDMAEHKAKPTNTVPGIEYMLAVPRTGAPMILTPPQAHRSGNPRIG